MTGVDVLVFGSIIALGLACSAMYSGMETGLYTINRVRLAVRAGHGDHAAVRIRAVLRRPTRMLATLLIANNIANYMSSFGIAALLDRAGYSPVQAVVLNAAFLIPVLFVFGEILPKDLFRTHTDHWTYRCSLFLRGTERVLTWSLLVPLVERFGAIVGRLTGGDPRRNLGARQRMSRLIREGAGAGVLSDLQASLADRAMVLRERHVGGEMVPWREVVTLAPDADPTRIAAVTRRHPYTRYPVVDARGRVHGIVSSLDLLLEPEARPGELCGTAVVLDPDLPVRDALRTMRDQKVAMAVVADEQPVGIVTLKDLVEPLTGELASW